MNEIPITVHGLTLNVARLENSKPPLIMLHGVTRRWSTFLPVMQALSLRWQVHAVDLRGHGKSDRAGEYRVIDYVGDIVGMIQQTLSAPAVIYGHSLGAMVAAAVASELKQPVRAVVLEDPPMQTMGSGITDNILHSFFTGLQQFAGDPRPVADIARQLADIQLHDPQQNRQIRMGDIRDAVQLRFTAASLKRVDPNVFTSILAGQWMQNYDTERIFRTLPCPALLLQADMNCGGMLADQDAALLKHHSPDLTHVKLDGVGHVVHVAATHQLVNLVSAFLESV